MSTLKVSTIQDTSGNNSSTPAGIASGTAKAWVNFNGTGTVAIRSSFNVASITDNGTGDYTVNFTTAMADTNYATVGVSSLNATGSGSGRSANCFNPRDLATSSVRLYIVDGTNGNSTDVAVSNVAIFR
tara:strand:+ start:321 stop:707 length:387 start_codon:yes stop_codon:yes gene_type:complete